MSLEIAWLALLGLLLAGYFVLGGYDYGVQMLHPFLGRDDSQRRSTLRALGPFFLGNEVWLVAFAGVLFGAFPLLEGTLLSGLYALVAAIVLGVVVGNAAVQLRSRHRGTATRSVWDALIAAGGAVPAVSWGLVLGVMLRGVPLTADGSFTLSPAMLLDPFVLLCGATTAALFAAHGAAFLSLRTTGELVTRAVQTARPLLAVAMVLTAASATAGTSSPAVRAAVANPIPAVVLALGLLSALAVAHWASARGRCGLAFGMTSCAAALPVPLVGAGLFPYLLASSVREEPGLTVAEAAADPATLRILLVFAATVVPLILLFQFWNWWAFRGRVDETTPRYF